LENTGFFKKIKCKTSCIPLAYITICHSQWLEKELMKPVGEHYVGILKIFLVEKGPISPQLRHSLTRKFPLNYVTD
jgi:hypothetical protein